jgi:hypothetical protein
VANTIKQSEKETQKAVLKYLEMNHSKYMHWRNNSGAMKTEAGGFYFFGAVGSPDIFVLWKGVLYGLEVKSTGGKQSEGQKEFERKMNLHGGIYKVIFSLDDVRALGL